MRQPTKCACTYNIHTRDTRYVEPRRLFSSDTHPPPLIKQSKLERKVISLHIDSDYMDGTRPGYYQATGLPAKTNSLHFLSGKMNSKKEQKNTNRL
jgi:hypothetical protein